MQNRTSYRCAGLFLVMGLAMVALALPNNAMAQDQATTPTTAASNLRSGSRAPLELKLERIVIDKINFDKADVVEVIGFLQKKSRELDPDKQGVNFVVSHEFKPEDHVHREVSLTLENVSLAQILEAICTQTNLQYSVEDYAVFVGPATDQSEIMSVRTYLVPAGFFANAPSSTSGEMDAKNLLMNQGISFPNGSTATFVSVSGKLVVRDTPKQLDQIAKLFDTYNHLGDEISSHR